MSNERDVQTPSGIIKVFAKQPPTPEEIAKYKETVILTRSLTASNLKVDLPNDLAGQWVVNTPLEIKSAEDKGFVIDSEYAGKSSLHGDGSGRGIVGDVVHMVIPKWKKEIIDQVNHEAMVQFHGDPTSMSDARIAGRYVNTPPATKGIQTVDESKQYKQELTPTQGN